MKDYSKVSDEELIRMLRRGEDSDEYSIIDYLLEKYKPLVRSMSRTRFISGGDDDDLIQEGMIGLFKAVQNYDEEKNALFATFARLCIERQQMSAITKSNRYKNSMLNNSEPLIEEVAGEGLDNGENGSPEMIIIDRENTYEMLSKIQSELSKMEKTVFWMYVEGFEYTDIAKKLGKTPKSIDNAIQRIKKKVRSRLSK